MDIPGIAEAAAAGPDSVFAAGIAMPSIFCAGMGVGDAAVGRGREAGALLVGVTGLAGRVAVGFAAGFFFGAGIGIDMPFISIPCADAAPAEASVVLTASAAKAMRFMPLLHGGAR
jgi:hypothetical protein